MKVQADKHRSERVLAVGDWVFVKLQPYRQSTVRGQSYHKLSPRYFGPFQIIRRVGEVAYTLQLPPESKIHPTFHISQLKKKKGSQSSHIHLPISLTTHGHVLLAPHSILDRRLVQRNNKPVAQVLIKWFNMADEDSTWEDYDDMQRRYPTFDS